MKPLKELFLADPKLTLAVAESLTCGRVQSLIGAESGASGYFVGGITAYTLEQKVRHLGVDRATAAKVNSVSADVAAQMARGVCALFDAHVSVATTGYAEPSPAEGVTYPFAWWAIAFRPFKRGAYVVHTGRVECRGAARQDTQRIVAEAAVAELASVVRAWRATYTAGNTKRA